MEKKIIWDENATISPEDIKDDYPECDESALVEIADELLYAYLDDERANLDIELNGTIICFAEVGRWNGTYYGYRPVGSNISDTLRHLVTSPSTCCWYLNEDMTDLCGDEAHHDATNHYIYRLVSNEDLEAAENQDDYVNWLRARSHSIAEHVRKVYGW